MSPGVTGGALSVGCVVSSASAPGSVPAGSTSSVLPIKAGDDGSNVRAGSSWPCRG